jgi:hypothetical protein
MEKDNGGPAFPQPQTVTDGQISHPCDYDRGGMSLRDWFAGQALLVVLQKDGSTFGTLGVARAYRIADMMIEERKK